jgi:hypothetical protein
MLNVVMLSVANKPVMLSAFILNVVMLNVVAPRYWLHRGPGVIKLFTEVIYEF